MRLPAAERRQARQQMGDCIVKNGFENIGEEDAASIEKVRRRIFGQPEPFGVVANRVVESHRTRLLRETSKRAHVWGSMPKPPSNVEG